MRSGPAVGQAAPLIFVPFFVACLAFYFAGWPKMSDVIVFRNILIQKNLVQRIAALCMHSRRGICRHLTLAALAGSYRRRGGQQIRTCRPMAVLLLKLPLTVLASRPIAWEPSIFFPPRRSEASGVADSLFFQRRAQLNSTQLSSTRAKGGIGWCCCPPLVAGLTTKPTNRDTSQGKAKGRSVSLVSLGGLLCVREVNLRLFVCR